MLDKEQALQWDTPLQYIKGVGPRLASLFKTRSLSTVKDFVYFLPRNYQDNRRVSCFADIRIGSPCIVISTIVKKNIIPLRRQNKKMYEIIISDGQSLSSCKFFRSPYKGWFNSLHEGQQVEVQGVLAYYRDKLEFHHPQIFPLKESETSVEKEDLILPFYPEISNISQNKIRQIMKTIFTGLESNKENLEWLPQWLREKYDLLDLFESLKGFHFPDKKDIDNYLNFKTKFHKRIIFDEFFELQFYLALKKQGWAEGEAPQIPVDQKVVKTLENQLPFVLTSAQKKVINSILLDLQSKHPMHRLIQGDVGSGKTIVSLMTALACVRSGYQVAFMVPTEILAEQHYNNARQFLATFKVKVEKLTGKMKAQEKKRVNSLLASGDCNLCIGTHALIQENVDFHKLGLVIIDEQHRFGAHQRACLKQKGNHPHFLVMTATPIPRTLSLSLYGDLDISIIDELPLGRKPITTRRAFHSQRLKVFNFLKEEIQKGQQGYVVYPLVEESEKLELKNVMDQYEKLKSYYKELKWGIITGRMTSEEKQEVMHQFKDKKIDVLVSTTVIEVGIDVPNATVMIIEHAERFGLSQLHQLRGRVGRGQSKSYCIMILGQNFSKEARERTEILSKTSDGFQIAEKDLELRGPGEFLGSRQSGLPNFKVAHLVRDSEILFLAQKATSDLISKDLRLHDSDHSHLKLKFQNLLSSTSPG